MAASDEIIGEYRMYHLIRAGALYEIWAVRPMSGTDLFAVKYLPKGQKYSRQAVAELKHEYEVGKALEHPAVIKTYEFGSTKTGAYLLMEYFKTPNLKQQITANVKALQWRVKELLTNAAAGLAHMHEKGWVHRDIKPDNYLVNDENEVRLIDFTIAAKQTGGLGKLFGGKAKVQGTYSYMAPEQIRGQGVDPRDDIYSFGCMVHELLAGKVPFTANSPNELLQRHLKAKPPTLTVADPNIHPQFAAYVQNQLLAKERKDRPSTMKEVMMKIKAEPIFYMPPKKPEPELEGEQESKES
ncbi:Serine/threonine-protein kinase PknB [Pseudobythopirellula maris]|uniref:Serine/threonine-protein kinase PknB n=1 Tax=Pseudobythopirellula maris TaxID=2527991 RepID=A0A5C5ZHH3_9BACT|nr:serine/threonine-protein kinase [Pseudobythopirellula maris]TWT86794.1 Serine/threonine-protein kinase PknB [Pseudobythopirellula maris]